MPPLWWQRFFMGYVIIHHIKKLLTLVNKDMVRNKKIFIIISFIMPLLMGAFIYYLLSPDVIFVKFIDEVMQRNIHFSKMMENNILMRFVRFYLLDMLWGYALVFALYFILGDNTAKLKNILFIAFMFSALMEFLQLTPFAKGTFDIADILFVMLSEVIAVFIIKILLRRHN